MSLALARKHDTTPAGSPSEAPRPAQDDSGSAPHMRLVTGSGASAELVCRDEAELIRVRDPGGAILFEYDARAGKGTLRMPTGDLRLEALQGNIQLVAGKGVQCVAGGEVALRSASAASVTVGGAGGPPGEVAGLRVEPGRAALSAGELVARAKSAEIHFQRARYLGDLVEATVARAESAFGELTTRADTLIEKANNVFCQVKELHQLNAGRLRTLIEGALRLEGGHVVMHAREDVHIDGEHINLG